jgi:transmembrane sensor
MRRPPHTPVPDNDAIETAAADWLARRDRGLSPEEAEQFAAWEAADARHTAELTRLDATWRLLDTADEVPDIMQLAHEMEATEKRPTARRRWRPWALAAAGLGVAAVLAMTWTAFLRAPWLLETAGRAPAAAAGNRSYHVVPGAAQRLTLADGTLVELNADSAVNTAFSATERTVQVLRGEAHFAVVKDAVRPFVVHAGNVTVRAVGTAFNVRIDSTAVEVLVTEGRVRVDDAARGESLLAPATATPADIERLLAWRSPQLVFERTSLEDAVAAFNSFNRCQLVLGDPALRTRRLGGTFRADNLEAFVRLLEKGFNIVADTSDGRAIVLHAAAARQKD